MAPRSWSDAEIAARGFDPVSGRRMDGYPIGENDGQLVKSKAPNPARIIPKNIPTSLSASARSYLKPEQLLQVEVIETLRPKLVEGAKLLSLCGELPGGSRLFKLWQTVRQAMGYEAGTPDLLVLYDGSAWFIELKRARGEPDLLGDRKARGELSTPQRRWRNWAKAQGFRWALCRSVAEVETALAGWRLLR